MISFADVKDARARRAKELAQKLYFFASEYPELARHLRKAIKPILKEAQRSPASDRDSVLAALEASCHTYAEIAAHTKLPYHTVRKIVNRSNMTLLIELRQSPPLIEPGRGGRRRPEILIYLR